MLQTITEILLSLESINTYELRDWDDSSTPTYIGRVNANGNWTIDAVDVSAETIRTARGAGGYVSAWADRANLVYGY